MPSLNDYLLIILAVGVFGKPAVVVLSRFLPGLTAFLPLFEAKNGNGGNGGNGKPAWAVDLIEHYNHSTTSQLDKLIAANEREYDQHQQIIEAQKETNTKLDLVLREGVRVRT